MKGGPALLAAAALAAMLTAAAAARAQETGAYLGGSLGQAKLTQWCDGGGLTACKDTDTAWKLFGGYRFNKYVAAEASYIDWGEVTASQSNANFSAKQHSYGIAAVGNLELAPQWAIFGKLGFVQTEQKTQSPSSTRNRDDTEILYGLGVRFTLAPNWAVRGEWENTDKLKVQLLSVGAEYRF